MEKYTAVSVVIPLYNKRSHIIDTLETVLAQSLPAFEIVVVDDGSTDDGASLVAQKIATDKRFNEVRLIVQKNGGVSCARNRGIEEARGTHVAFLDADDSWESHYLEEIQLLMCRYPNAIAYATNYQKRMAGVGFVDPKIRLAKKIDQPTTMSNFFEICSQGDLPFMTSSICIAKAVLARVGNFPEGEPMGEDQDLWARLALSGVIAYSPRVLAFYHLDSENRACLNHVPSEECPYSCRLNALVKEGGVDKALVPHILKYTAAHLLQLVRENIQVGRSDVAERLLADERCRLLPAKRLLMFWELKKARLLAA